MSIQGALLRHAALPAYEYVRRRGLLAYAAEYERNQWLPREEIERLQWRKLQRLLRHCWSEVPFYRGHWHAAGLGDIAEIRSMRDFERLPLLTKEHVRTHWDRMVSPAHRADLLVKATSGSTGMPMRLGYDRESYDRRVAVMHRGYGWTGARMGERTVYLWGGAIAPLPWWKRTKERLHHAAFNRLMLNTDTLDEATLDAYVASINAFRPETIVGFVMAVDMLAQHVLSRGIRLHSPRRVLTAAESLHPHQRARIGQALGAPVHDTYGCREVMLIAAECGEHDGLHVNSDHLVAECVAHGAIDGGAGEVVLTDLHNYGMPLVRYANGDMATPSARSCGCGRGLPLWKQVDGRVLDALKAADGRLVAGQRIVALFMGIPGLRQFQAYQPEPRVLEIRLVPMAGFDMDAIAPAIGDLRRKFGDGMEIRVSLHDEIPAGPGGKRRVTRRDIA